MSGIGTDAVLANWAIDAVLIEANRHLHSGDLARAEQLCRQALAKEPCASEAWRLLAIVLGKRQQFADAAFAAQRACELLPSNASYWVTRGIIASDQHLLTEAQGCFRSALTLDPKLFEAQYLLGRSYHLADKFPEAIAAYRKALRGSPESPAIRFHLARALLASDQVREALAAFQEAFARDPEGRLDRRECFDCFGRLTLKSLPAFWQMELTKFFSRPDIGKSRYAAVALYVLVSKQAFRSLLGTGGAHGMADPGAISEVLDDPLFGTLLRDAVIAHPQFELMLTELRCKLLLDVPLRAAAPLQFLCDLAVQCFNNEFVYAESPGETAELARLAPEIERGLRGGGRDDDRFIRSLAVFAMYRPLHALASIENLLAELPCPEAASLLFRRTVEEPLEERRLRSVIPSIGQITNPVSCRVRDQYEENPYPRWIASGGIEQVPASSWIEGDLPGLGLPWGDPGSSLNFLVAGCGTGLEAVSLAAKIAGVRVTALDLSLSSLAYAQRNANELGLENIEFFQADILELAGWPKRFDVIISAGVLHHLDAPQEGLRTLAHLMRPGGLLKIGLYSERARSGVNALRKVIRERNLQPTAAAIRSMRQEVLRASAASPLSGPLRWRDFYTMSECRDLLFHVQEHQFTLTQIDGILRSLGLTVLGMSRNLPPQSVQAYRRMAPGDLHMADLIKWDAVEARFPGTFEGMYMIWCRTPLSPAA